MPKNGSLYAYFGHHKCGSRWVSLILEDVCKVINIKFDRVSWRGQVDARSARSLLDHVNRNEIGFLAFINANYKFVPELVSMRGFHLVRDPRDICVSSYFSHLHSHPIRDWHELAVHREALQKVSEDEGLLLDMRFNEWVFRDIESWNYRDSRIYEGKLDVVAQNPAKYFYEILKFIGLIDEYGVSYSCVSDIIEKHRFEVLSGGRLPGEVDVHSHYRAGVSGEWKSMFSDIHHRYCNEHLSGAIFRSGYSDG